jgi:hypothetical protein
MSDNLALGRLGFVGGLPDDSPQPQPQSPGFDVWEAFYNIITADSFFADYTIRPTRMNPIQMNGLPYLGIYLSDEDDKPDGDANAGNVRFSASSKVCFSLILANSDRIKLFRAADAASYRIKQKLWTDYKLMNIFHNDNPDGVGIESIPRGQRRWNWGSTGANNETPFVECRYDVTAFWREPYWPDITDTLNEIDVSTGVKPGDTQEQMDQREQERVTYLFNNQAKAAANAARRPTRFGFPRNDE